MEESRIRGVEKLERLILLIATASIVAVSEGLSVFLLGKREQVDPHWRQGLSYFQMGLRWILSCVIQGVEKVFAHCLLRPSNNPIPVAPTEKESRRRYKMKNPQTLFKDVQFFGPLT